MADIEQLETEKSAVALSLAETRDAAAERDAIRREADDLKADLDASKNENASLREQLNAIAGLREDLEKERKQAGMLGDENQKLQERVRDLEREAAIRADTGSGSLLESKLRRRINELEDSLRTSEAVMRQLKARVESDEADHRKRETIMAPAPPPVPPEKVVALEARIIELEGAVNTGRVHAKETEEARQAAADEVERLRAELEGAKKEAGELRQKLEEASSPSKEAEVEPPSEPEDDEATAENPLPVEESDSGPKSQNDGSLAAPKDAKPETGSGEIQSATEFRKSVRPVAGISSFLIASAVGLLALKYLGVL